SSILLFVSVVCDHAIFLFFFFQAEDGIRDDLVTGVQTCALPICVGPAGHRGGLLAQHSAGCRESPGASKTTLVEPAVGPTRPHRSEERRVGKESGSEGWGDK